MLCCAALRCAYACVQVELKQLQGDLLRAQWSATRAAEEQAASLKRLADQSAVDASKSHQMLAEVSMT